MHNFWNLLLIMSDKRSTSVIVVGAGVAGLQASRLLREESIPVVLLEGRDRIGGRVHTSTHTVKTITGESVTIRHDEGAAWVHGLGFSWPEVVNESVTECSPPRNPMLALLQEASGSAKNLWSYELNPVFPKGNPWMRPKSCLYEDDQLAVYCEGKLLDNALLVKSLDRHWTIMDEIENLGQMLLKSDRYDVTLKKSLREALNRVLKMKEFRQQRNKKDYMKLEQLRQFYVHLIELWYAGSVDTLQLSEFVDLDQEVGTDGDASYECQGDFFGPHCTVTSGMSIILTPLTNHGEEILLSQEVISIREMEDKIEVRTRSGLILEAAVCIVTIPLACLKARGTSIFHPTLSSDKLEALKILKVGQYKKVFLTFDTIFWAEGPAFLGFLLPNSMSPLGKHLLADNLWARNGIPCLEVVLTAEAAVWAKDKPDHVIRDTVIAFLMEAVNVTDLNCLSCYVTRWEEDPFSLGAYSNFGIGSQDRHSAAFRQPDWDGKLIFAGEHTISECEGSVHAALYSGYNAAKSVIEYLTKIVDFNHVKEIF
jgi:monoamine oxidase